MKRIFILLVCGFNSTVLFASTPLLCPQAVPDDKPGFCASFKSVAECHCEEMGIPKGMCQKMSMNDIYNQMISMFGSQQKACQYQHDTSFQTCMDDWNCYRLGGTDSQHRLCNATGSHC